jgi:hypothetical protein
MTHPSVGFRPHERLRTTLVALYPPTWQDRYGKEYLALLEETPLDLRGVANVVQGAARAWVRPRGPWAAAARFRATLSVVWVGWVLAAVGMLFFAQMTEDSPFRVADGAHPVLGSLYDACVATGLLSVVATAAGSVSLLIALWRDRRSRGRAWMLVAPITAPALFVVLLIVVAHIARHRGESAVSLPAPVAIGVMLLGAAAILVCAALPPAVMRRLDLSAAAMRVSVITTVPIVATTVIAAGTSVAYAIVLGDLTPRLDATVGLPAVLIPYALVVGAACIAATVSSLRGLRLLFTATS